MIILDSRYKIYFMVHNNIVRLFKCEISTDYENIYFPNISLN